MSWLANLTEKVSSFTKEVINEGDQDDPLSELARLRGAEAALQEEQAFIVSLQGDVRDAQARAEAAEVQIAVMSQEYRKLLTVKEEVIVALRGDLHELNQQARVAETSPTDATAATQLAALVAHHHNSDTDNNDDDDGGLETQLSAQRKIARLTRELKRVKSDMNQRALHATTLPVAAPEQVEAIADVDEHATFRAQMQQILTDHQAELAQINAVHMDQTAELTAELTRIEGQRVAATARCVALQEDLDMFDGGADTASELNETVAALQQKNIALTVVADALQEEVASKVQSSAAAIKALQRQLEDAETQHAADLARACQDATEAEARAARVVALDNELTLSRVRVHDLEQQMHTRGQLCFSQEARIVELEEQLSAAAVTPGIATGPSTELMEFCHQLAMALHVTDDVDSAVLISKAYDASKVRADHAALTAAHEELQVRFSAAEKVARATQEAITADLCAATHALDCERKHASELLSQCHTLRAESENGMVELESAKAQLVERAAAITAIQEELVAVNTRLAGQQSSAQDMGRQLVQQVALAAAAEANFELHLAENTAQLQASAANELRSAQEQLALTIAELATANEALAAAQIRANFAVIPSRDEESHALEHLQEALDRAQREVTTLRVNLQSSEHALLLSRQELDDLSAKQGPTVDALSAENCRLQAAVAQLQADLTAANHIAQQHAERMAAATVDSNANDEKATLTSEVAKLAAKLSALQGHLLEVEEGNTEDSLRRDEQITYLQQQLADARGQAAAAESAARELQTELESRTHTWSQTLARATDDNRALTEDLARTQARCDRTELSVTNLEGVLQQFDAERDAAVHAAVQGVQAELAVVKAAHNAACEGVALAAADAAAAVHDRQQLAAQISSMSAVCEAALALQVDVQRLQEELDQAHTRLSLSLTGVDAQTIDKELMRNMLVSYVTSDRRDDVMQVFATLLSMSDDERYRVGLHPKRGFFASLLSGPVPPPTAPVSNQRQTFTEQFVRFLLKEATQPPVAVSTIAAVAISDSLSPPNGTTYRQPVSSAPADSHASPS